MWLDEPPYVIRHTCRDCPTDCGECSWADESCTCQLDHTEDEADDDA
jgi:hypothetical protein